MRSHLVTSISFTPLGLSSPEKNSGSEWVFFRKGDEQERWWGKLSGE